jgi:RNA polymerase sigma-70 factor (ECF subfamily)
MVSGWVEAEERLGAVQGSDEELVEATRAGDVHAFAGLVERYRDAAYGTALHVLAEPCEAAEVAQDAFIRAYWNLPQLREPSRFSAWLCRIAMNLARRRLARRRTAPALMSLEEGEDMLDPEPSGGQAAERSEVVEVIRQLMRKLPDEQRLTFTLFYVDGYTHKELSEMLAVPVGTVKSRLSSARSQLKEEVVQMAKKAMRESRPDAEFWRSATGVATGRVTSASTGEPVEGAKVRLYEPQTVTFAAAKSGADGVWEARELVPGPYSITVRHPDLVPQTYRGELWGNVRTSAIVRPGQTVRDIDFQLEPGASIRGKVVATDGSPVADASVSVWRRFDPPHEEVLLDRVAHADTDEGGGFDIGSLAAGAYLVGVQAGEKHEEVHFAPVTYYPGTFSLHDAEWVEASAGKVREDLVIPLADVGTVRLRVRVSESESGRPIPRARVLVNRRDADWDMFTGYTDESGCFHSGFLTRGPFQVTVGAEQQGYPRWSKWIDVQGGEAEVNLAFQLPKGAVFEGRVVAQDSSELPPLKYLSCYLIPSTEEQSEGRPCRTTGVSFSWSWGPGEQEHWQSLSLAEGPQFEQVRADESGHIQSPPVTPGSVVVNPYFRDKDWRVIGVSVRGEPLRSGESIECRPGERIDTLEIVIGTNLGVVAGRVISSADKKPIEGVWVHLSRSDNELFYGTGRDAASPIQADRSGSFFFHSVPAGPYVLGVARLQDKPVEEGSKRDIVVEPGGVVHLDLVLANAV